MAPSSEGQSAMHFLPSAVRRPMHVAAPQALAETAQPLAWHVHCPISHLEATQHPSKARQGTSLSNGALLLHICHAPPHVTLIRLHNHTARNPGLLLPFCWYHI